MSKSIVISSRVVETIKSLPEDERRVISAALASELILGENPEKELTPFQAMIYSMIRYYVRRDTERCDAGMFDGVVAERWCVSV